jgi:3-hydroxyacyl-[acyl-carrier-protein] dehydratase
MLTAAELLARIPWRHPFLLVDRVLDCVPGERIRTLRAVTANDPLTRFGEGGASLPSLLLIEGMSQSAALLYDASYPDRAAELPLLGFLSARLHAAARPGDAVVFEVESIKMTSTGGLFRATAAAGGSSLADAELAFAARERGAVASVPGAGEPGSGPR